MGKLYKRSAMGGFLLSVSCVAAAMGCPPVIDSIWQESLASATSAIEGAITGMTESVTAAKSLNTQQILSAMRVLVKQISVTSEQQIAADIAAKSSGASYLAELSNRKAIFNATMDYSPATGQGFDPCGELLRSKGVAVSIGEANRDMQEKVLREIDAAPGRFVRNRAGNIDQRLAVAKELYCTPQEAASGLCRTPGPLAGKDVDAAHFFTSFDASSPEGKAKSALLNNMFGAPQQAITKEAAMSPGGQAFLESKRNSDAIGSVSMASMKAIQSWTESRGTGSGRSDSVLDALSKKVGVYSGGENYDAWERSKLSQSERGLLVEYAKMAATELYMLHAEYQQQERIEMNVSAWQALRARQGGTSGERQAQSNAAHAAVN